MNEYIDLTIDFAKRNDRLNGITLDRVTTRSYDTAIKFRIEIIGHTLDDTYDVKILSKYHKSDFKILTTLGERLEIVDGKLIYTPKVNLITEADYVRNYLYLSKDGLGLDMAQFNYQVDVSQIGEITLDIRQAYDESYEALLAEFEQALEDYKLTLPQADSVRAEIDVILNQFGVDSQLKLSQYDTEAQQAIADNQTAFGLAETGRQDTYEQAEDIRNQASNQAVTDWEQGADALLETVEGNESARVDAEEIRKTNESTRVDAEIARKSAEASREVSEDSRQANEASRVADENIRKANEDDRKAKEVIRQASYLNKATGIIAENLVVNGDFEADTPTNISAGGFYPSVKTFDTTNSVRGRSIVNAKHPSGATRAFAGLNNLVPNRKYYYSVWYMVDGPNNIIWTTTSLDGLVSATVNSNPSVGEWYKFTHTFTATNTGIFMVGGAVIENQSLYFDDLMMIDLTQTFGAGNEPTKAEMDDIIAKIGYFNGKKEIVTVADLHKGKANRKQEDWITPTLLNGWEPFDSVNSIPKYRKDDFGRVFFKGSVKRKSGTGIIFTLPVGYRVEPGSVAYFNVNSNNTTGAYVYISGGNNVVSSLILAPHLSLDGINFEAGA